MEKLIDYFKLPSPFQTVFQDWEYFPLPSVYSSGVESKLSLWGMSENWVTECMEGSGRIILKVERERVPSDGVTRRLMVTLLIMVTRRLRGSVKKGVSQLVRYGVHGG